MMTRMTAMRWLCPLLLPGLVASFTAFPGEKPRSLKKSRFSRRNELNFLLNDKRTTQSPTSRWSSSSNNNDGNDRVVLNPKFVQRHQCWVVLVDDEESIRMSVGDFLYDEGYKVSACDGADALLQLLDSLRNEEELPNVIVSDIRMPGMDGIELLSLLRAPQSRYQRIPVVLLTAKAMTVDRITGFQAGADAYLPRPFHPDELLSILDNTILRRQQMKQAQSSLATLKQEMTAIKSIMQQNSAQTVKQTNVYLTPAERDVLELVCQGYTNKEIAAERGVTLDRIIKIVQKLFRDTETTTRTQLVRWAFQTGYASPRH